MTRPIVAAFVADTHINSTVGLCEGPVELDDGGTYAPSKGQNWLAQCWRSLLDDVKTEVGERKARLYGVVDGDMTDLGVGFSTQVITRNQETILGMGMDIYEPVARLCDRFFVVRGTEIHTGGSGYTEEKIAGDLGAERCAETGTASWWHLSADFGGVLFDICHHGKTGRLPWTLVNGMGTVAETVMSECVRHKKRVPDVAIRAHCHLSGDTGQNYPVRVVQLPAFQLCTGYSHKVFPDTLAHIGGAIAVIENGRLDDLRLVKFEPENDVAWKDGWVESFLSDEPEEVWQEFRE